MQEDPVCKTCGGELHYVAAYGAPGKGSDWKCIRDHHWALVGGVFYDPSEGAHIMTIEDAI